MQIDQIFWRFFMVDLSHVVNTGAGRGIGKGIAFTLARAGASVVLTDIADTVFQTAKEVQKLNAEVLPIKCDVSNYEQVLSTQKQVIGKFNKLDILVNNAGIYPQKSFLEMTPADWSTVVSINQSGTFYFTKAFIEVRLRGKYQNRKHNFPYRASSCFP
jgi:NAD(P)-dependent dehydrogenase (short-subunit alcohol dehydrogenase family)